MAVDEKITRVSLGAVKVRAARHRKARESTRAARDEMDVAILAARKAGATYREIAAQASVSTAWVQASLERSGYQTTPR